MNWRKQTKRISLCTFLLAFVVFLYQILQGGPKLRLPFLFIYSVGFLASVFFILIQRITVKSLILIAAVSVSGGLFFTKLLIDEGFPRAEPEVKVAHEHYDAGERLFKNAHYKDAIDELSKSIANELQQLTKIERNRAFYYRALCYLRLSGPECEMAWRDYGAIINDTEDLQSLTLQELKRAACRNAQPMREF